MKKKLSAMVIVVVIAIVGANCDKLYAAFFNRYTKEIQNQACVLDFEIMGDFSGQQFLNAGENIKFNENNEAFIPIDFDIKNSGNCEMYIRVAIFPVILDNSDLNYVYKLSKSSCKFQYYNENGENNLDDKYWEKSLDGFYYYKNVLKEGETLENKLVSGIKLNLKKEEKIDFADRQIKISVIIEAKQNEFIEK